MNKMDKVAVQDRIKAIAKQVKDSTRSEDVYAYRDELRAQADDIDSFWVEYPPPPEPPPVP